MHIMFNNPLVYVVEYAGLEAVEVIDKRRGVGALFRVAARSFVTTRQSAFAKN